MTSELENIEALVQERIQQAKNLLIEKKAYGVAVTFGEQIDLSFQEGLKVKGYEYRFSHQYYQENIPMVMNIRAFEGLDKNLETIEVQVGIPEVSSDYQRVFFADNRYSSNSIDSYIPNQWVNELNDLYTHSLDVRQKRNEEKKCKEEQGKIKDLKERFGL